MSGSTGSYFPRWQLAALIGAPIALGIGYLYYRSSAKVESGIEKKKINEVEKAVSIDKDDVPEPKKHVMTPLEKAQMHKSDGNKAFHEGNYDRAIEAYDKAIAECPKEHTIDLATFYQNRAAAHEHLSNWEAVIKDCTEAFTLNTTYVKAIQRRAKAHEKLGELEKSLEDITAVCILQRFNNSSSLLHADRVLRAVGEKHAKDLMKDRKSIPISKSFVKTYFASFLNDPIVNIPISSENATGFVKAKNALDRQEYEKVIEYCTDEIDAETESEYKNHARLLRATFYVISGLHKQGEEDLVEILSKNDLDKKLKVNALIKLSSLYVQTNRLPQCFESFVEAEDTDPKNSDLYHHRGQVYLLQGNLQSAIRDFSRAVELSPTDGISFIHKWYAEYRLATEQNDLEKMSDAMANFNDAIVRFPDCSECYSILAQLLSEQQRLATAEEFFAKACNIDPTNATLYVHRGLLKLQEGDITEALKFLHQAIEIDDRCEFAYETLGTVEVQRGNLEEAVNHFTQAIGLAKSELELTHLCSLRDAAVAQLNVVRKFGIEIKSLTSFGANMDGNSFAPPM